MGQRKGENMNNEIFNLKDFREAIGLTQRELADKINISQSTLNGWEQNPKTITLNNIVNIANETGYKLQDLLEFEDRVFGNNTFKLSEKSQMLRSDSENMLQEFNNYIESSSDLNDLATLQMQLKTLSNSINLQNRKLNLAVFGKSDAGKSTMINTLIGEEVSPTQWSAATRSIIKFVHIDDKPPFMEDDNTVVISTSIDENPVSLDNLYDQEFMEKNMNEKGDRSLIKTYGVHNKKLILEENMIYTIYSFVNSDILKGINIIDTPGTSTGYHKKGISDTNAADNTRSEADLVIYASPLNQFLHNEDQVYLKTILDYLPNHMDKTIDKPFSNIWIVATQAQSVDNALEEFFKPEGIRDKALENFMNTVPDEYISKKGEQYVDALKDRLFLFSRDSKSLTKDFKDNFLANISEYIENSSKSSLSNFNVGVSEIVKLNNKQIDEFNNNSHYINEVREDLETRKVKRPEVFTEIDKTFKNSILHTKYYMEKSINDFRADYETIMSTDYIIDLINKKEFKNRKKDKEALSNLISNIIGDKINSITEKYAGEFTELLKKDIDSFAINVKFYNFKRSLLSLLSGGLAGGALYYYMGTLGNLGGYILVTQTVGLLSSLGISVGGGAVATSAIAAVGGPVTIAIAASALLTISLFTVTGIGWKKSLAKKIISTFENEDALNLYLESIRTYWEDTKNSLIQNKAALKKQYDLELQHLENEASQNPEYFGKLANMLEKENITLKKMTK